VFKNFHLKEGNKSHLLEQIIKLDPTKDYSVSIIEWKSKRTIDQNSRLWKLYAELGKHIGLDGEEVHQLMGYRFLRYQKDVGGEVQEFVKSTTKLNTKEMSEYQDGIERWGHSLGFYFSET